MTGATLRHIGDRSEFARGRIEDFRRRERYVFLVPPAGNQDPAVRKQRRGMSEAAHRHRPEC